MADEAISTSLPWEQNINQSPGPTPSPINNDTTNTGISDKPPWETFSEAKTQNYDSSIVKAEYNKNSEATKEATSFTEALETGWGLGATSILKQKPKYALPQDSPLYWKIAAAAGQMAGDLPANLVGFAAGAGGGLPTGPGAIVTGFGGAAALPAAIRSSMMYEYEHGRAATFKDFWAQFSKTAIDTTKAYVTGAATGFVGGAVGASAISTPIIKSSAQVASEIATMTTVGDALEGRVPEPEEFLIGGILLGGIKLVATPFGNRAASRVEATEQTRLEGKLRTIYEKTGVRPSQIMEDIKNNPELKQQVLSHDIQIPEKYLNETPGAATDQKSIPVEGEVSKAFPALADQTPSEMKMEPFPEETVNTGEFVNTEMSDAQKAIDSKIYRGENKVPTKNWSQKFDKFYTEALDDGNPIKLLRDFATGGKELPTSEDPYILFRLFKGNAGRFEHIIKYGTYDFKTLKTNGMGLKDTLAGIDNGREFGNYLASKHSLDLNAEGIKTPLDPIEAANFVKEVGSKYEKPAKEFIAFKNRNFQMLKDSGILSPEVYEAAVKKYPNHVSFYRLLEDNTKGGLFPSGGATVRNPIRSIKGNTELPIIDPIESAIKDAYIFMKLAEANRLTNSIVELRGLLGNKADELIPKVKTPMQKTVLSIDDINKVLADEGIEQVIENDLEIFRPRKVPLTDEQISRFVDGKREVYEVGSEIAKATRNLGRQDLNFFVKMLAPFAKTLREGTVLSPKFIVNNAIKDPLSAFLYSKGWNFPFVGTIDGIFEITGHGESWKNFLKGGGANAIQTDLNRDYISKNIWELNKQTHFLDSSKNTVRSPIEMLRVAGKFVSKAKYPIEKLREIGGIAENATRVGEFKNVTKGNEDINSIFEGAFAGREITVDFQRGGANPGMKALKFTTAFSGPSIQGTDKAIRMIKNNPLQLGARVLGGVIIPSILFYIAGHNTKWWRRQRPDQRDLSWNFVPDGSDDPTTEPMRIPKPPEIGLIGSFLERSLEAWKKEDPEAYKGFEKTILDQLTPNFLPNSLVAPLEHFANKSTFTGSPLVPYELQKVNPQDQWTSDTTETSKLIGKIIGKTPFGQIGPQDEKLASPIIIDNYVRGWAGSMGRYLFQALDKVGTIAHLFNERPTPPDSKWYESPFVGSFFSKYPSMTSKPMNDFYEKYDEFTKNRNSLKLIVKKKRVEEFQERRMDLISPRIDNYAHAINNKKNMVKFLNDAPGKLVSARNKREYIDKLIFEMNTEAEQANLIIKQNEAMINKYKKEYGK